MKLKYKTKYCIQNIFSFTFIISICFCNVVSAQENNLDTTSFEIEYFYDSSHHWYDIREEKRVIDPIRDQKRYNANEITNIADNILLFQKSNGGWAKNYDMLAVLTNAQTEKVIRSKDETNTTFDNGTTYSQVDYLAKVYSVSKENKYKFACLKGLNYIFDAQYSNGGWPQFFPDTSGYRKYITFNDGAMIGIMKMLFRIVERETHFLFLEESIYERSQLAFNKGIECILNCQIIDNGILTVWGQQHDNIDFRPMDARTFEPAAICNGESAEIVELLMAIENPDGKIIQSIQSAVNWFKQSQINGIKVLEIKAAQTEFIYHSSSTDKEVVSDPNAQPIWTRFYELGTHRPMFCKRSGEIVYSLSEVERERRTGYAWYIYDPQNIIDIYPEWQKTWAPDNNVLAK